MSVLSQFHRYDSVVHTGFTGSAKIPTGTTAERDVSPANGYLRFNTSTGLFEGYIVDGWKPVGGEAIFVAFNPATSDLTSVNVQAAIEEVNTKITTSINALGSMSTQNSNAVTITGGSISGITDLAVADGGTGASTAAAAATNLGLGTTDKPQFDGLGIGTAASATAGEIRATNNITAYYSDERLKTNLGNIVDALEKVKTLNGFYYEANEVAQALGYEAIREVGVSAQQVQAVLPEVVVPAPIDEQYLTVRYEKLVPLLIEAIKELTARVEELEGK